jgi:hypothetical protein
MITITVEQKAPADTRYARDCFDSSIGRSIPFSVDDKPSGTFTVRAAEVNDDGTTVRLTLQFPDVFADGQGIGLPLELVPLPPASAPEGAA